MADTITLLDGLLFTKPTTADVYTIDGDGLEAVKSYPVMIPNDVSGARVIFNGAYDPDGGRYHVRVRVTALTAISGITKSQNTQPLEWTTVTPPAVQLSDDIDLANVFASTIHIDVAMSSTTANTTGIEIIVQIRKEVTVDEWTNLVRFIGPTGTAVKSDVATQTAAGETVLAVTNPATGKLDHVGKFIFLEDTATIAQCETAFLVSQSGD